MTTSYDGTANNRLPQYDTNVTYREITKILCRNVKFDLDNKPKVWKVNL